MRFNIKQYTNIPPLNSRKEDGKDHIRISPKANTRLGKLLAFQSNPGFQHDILGHFATVNAYWYYIQSKDQDDRLRVVRNRPTHIHNGRMETKRVANFKAMIVDGMYQRIVGNKELHQEVYNSTLPFDIYSKHEGALPMRPVFFDWILPALEYIRACIQAGETPCFDYIRDRRNVDIYADVAPNVEEIRANIARRKALKEARQAEQQAQRQAAALAEENAGDVDDYQVEELPVEEVAALEELIQATSQQIDAAVESAKAEDSEKAA